jgi:hypothetical protein
MIDDPRDDCPRGNTIADHVEQPEAVSGIDDVLCVFGDDAETDVPQ